MRPGLLAAAAALFLLAWPAAEAANIEGHPAVKAYPGSVITRRDNDGFRSYTIVVGVDPAGKTDETAFETLIAEGNTVRLAYENPKDRSAYEIYSNYRDGLERGGFEILFACHAKECGPGYAISRWNRVTGLRYTGKEMGYVAARASQGQQEIYVVAVVAQHRHQIEVVEVAAMETGLVNAKAIAEGMENDGRVVLSGIYFDTDKAVLKPESEPALKEIAAFLIAQPGLSAFITGHTDGTGPFEHNMALSLARARAVVTALENGYGIDPGRLAAHGVGPLSPRQSNETDAGRGENRRVEMVQRLPAP